MTRTDERGSVLVTALLALVVLATIGGVLARDSFADLGQTERTVTGDRAFHAAEAGVDDYIAKLTEDHSYYDHFTHPAESTRRPTTGADVAADKPWTGGTAWTYPLGRDAWRSLGDGVEYNVEVSRPTIDQPTVRIVATGRRAGDAGSERTVEAFVRPASIADFQMISNRDITYGATIPTYGKIYAGVDENGVAHNVTHRGEAHADVYAEGTVSWGSPVTGGLFDGAQAYTGATIRSAIRNPVNFNSFTGSLADIQGVARAGGLVLDDPSWDAWKLTLNAAGTIGVQGCDRVLQTVGATSTPLAIGGTEPVCGTTVTRTVPTNGAVWVAQDAIVLGQAKGRFTIASPTDIFVAGSVTYAEPGTDVVGFIAGRDMIVPVWAPNQIDWNAATLTITGIWRTWLTSDLTPTTPPSSLTFTGSTATNLGGYMSGYQTRAYHYDQNLLYLQPPYFPVLEEAYTIVLFREING